MNLKFCVKKVNYKYLMIKFKVQIINQFATQKLLLIRITLLCKKIVILSYIHLAIQLI